MAQAPYVRASVVPLSRHRLRREQLEIRVAEIDRLLRTLGQHMESIASKVEKLGLDYGEEIPAYEELRCFAIALGQIRGGLRQSAGVR